MKKLLAAFAVVLACGTVTVPAAMAESRTQTISYRDLDLSRPADVTKLVHRIKRAAAEFCDTRRSDDAPSADWHARSCRDKVTGQVLTAIGNPVLTARFENPAAAYLASR